MNKQSILLYISASTMLVFSTVMSNEVAEGFFGGGFLGAAIGGAAGGGRGAAIGGVVGSMLGAGMGASAREQREQEYSYYRDSDMLYEENEELSYENEQLIEEHKLLIQQKAYFEWMLKQCKLGKIDYSDKARRISFDDDTDYDIYLQWQDQPGVRRQNRMLLQINSNLRRINAQLKKTVQKLKQELRICEKRNPTA